MARTSILFTETIKLANFVTAKYPRNKTSATPEMTGIPADVLLAAKTKDMKIIISDLKSLFGNKFQEQHCPFEIDAGEVGGSAWHNRTQELMIIDIQYLST